MVKNVLISYILYKVWPYHSLNGRQGPHYLIPINEIEFLIIAISLPLFILLMKLLQRVKIAIWALSLPSGRWCKHLFKKSHAMI